MDGTLADTSEGIFACFRHAFSRLGEEPPAEALLRTFVGPPLLDSFLRVTNKDKERALAGVRAYRERYESVGWTECRLYRGVKETLTALVAAGVRLGVATCKPQPFAERILEKFGLDELFSCVVGSRLDNSFDDKAEIVALAMKNAGAKAEESAMVGDRASDILAAKKNGILPVGVRFGFAEKGELETAGAAYIADTFPAVGDYFLRGRK